MATAIIGKVVSKKGSKPAVAAKPAKAKKSAKVVEKPTEVVVETKPAEKPAKREKILTWPGKFKEGSIGRTIAEAILNGKLSNAEILAKVKETHNSDTTLACVSWYKSKWNKEKPAA